MHAARRASYAGHYRRMLPAVLSTLSFHSNNAVHRPVIEAIGWLKRFHEDGATSTWFDREIAGCSLADRRLTKRLRSLLERMGDAMGASILLACQDWANTKAAYRFFPNERVSEAEILVDRL